MSQRSLLLVIILVYPFFNSFAQVKTYHTVRIKGDEPSVDGRFDEEVWEQGVWSDDFTQFEPNTGEQPTQKTAFKLLYNDEYIFVAIKNYDSETSKISTRMSRRDGHEGDICGVHFDSYNDKRTAFTFLVSASGVKTDGIMTRDGDNYDESLDPVWFVKTRLVSDGWQAEMKIPLSQLRFGSAEELTWGFQVIRQIFRNDEYILWKPIERDKAGWISQYGELKGLQNIRARKQFELAPFVVSKMETYEAEEGNPYADGFDLGLDAGLDAKVAITNDIIMDLAINPDFGQVEADPSELNLSAFETFFEEKRPFFIEGTSITNYQITPGGNPWSRDNLLYSRRIGREPHYYPELEDGEFIEFPLHSRILGAAKITGKTRSGWSVGIIESLVNRESAKLFQKGAESNIEVEPLTNYLVGRLQKDINKGQTIIGGMVTATNRFIDHDEDIHLSYLPDAAYTGGIDITQFFLQKKYFVSTTLTGSYISGSRTAISDLQLASQRYFQRPDADYMEYLPERSKLTGHGGTLMFGKSAISGFRFLFNVTWRSPGFDLNDIGYLRWADNVFQFLWGGYEIINPVKGIRQMQINANQWAGWDFGSTNIFNGLNINTNFLTTNFWRFYTNYTYDFPNIDNSELRGGPSIHLPGGGNFNIGASTNSTKKITIEAGYNHNWSRDGHANSFNISGGITVRPVSSLAIRLNQGYNVRTSNLQYVDEFYHNDEPLYLFGKLHQKLLNLVLRLDYNITPDLTIQYYGSPFITAGLYDDYKKITDPDAEQYFDRYFTYPSHHIIHRIDHSLDIDNYGIDNNGNGFSDFYFDNPDFNFKQFRSNLVVRWEYIPGSVLFFVWTQGRTDFEVNGNFDYLRNVRQLFSMSSNDVFLIKLSHRFRSDY
jgi:hypothetical protein